MTKMYIMDVIKRLDNNTAYKKEVGVNGVHDALTKLLPMAYISTEGRDITQAQYSYIDYDDESTFFMHENNVQGQSFVRPEYTVLVNIDTLEFSYQMEPSPITLPANAPKTKQEAEVLQRRYTHFEKAIDKYVEQIDNYTEYQRVLSLNKDYREELVLINSLLRGKNNGTAILVG